LLARMQASREAYRSRFPSQAQPEQPLDPDTSLHHDQPFPRSHTFRFVVRHPYAAALAAGVLIAAIPGGTVKKAVKGSAVFAAGMIGGQARALMVRELLPSMIRLMHPRKR
ncbi:MAG TPA: hypothetical protein VHB01_07425, partial [Nitrosospira sp.]|nr:hypothetical protein [Nitrosospira sp.]